MIGRANRIVERRVSRPVLGIGEQLGLDSGDDRGTSHIDAQESTGPFPVAPVKKVGVEAAQPFAQAFAIDGESLDVGLVIGPGGKDLAQGVEDAFAVDHRPASDAIIHEVGQSNESEQERIDLVEIG